MRHRNVSDLMTTSVITVRRDTTFKEIAGLLAEHDITAVPVVDDNDCPVGMVSEADLLRKQAGQPAPAGLLSGAFQRSEPGTSEWHADLAKAAATSAEWLMTSPAVTARPEWTVVEAARVMEQHKVKRLPAVNEAGQLVGRGDCCVSSYAATWPSGKRSWTTSSSGPCGWRRPTSPSTSSTGR